MLKSLVSEKQLTQLVYSAWPLRHLAVSVCLCVLCVRERELCLFRSEFEVKLCLTAFFTRAAESCFLFIVVSFFLTHL